MRPLTHPTKDQIKTLAKQAHERIESAEALVKIGNLRDAISRVYYGFFDAATAALYTKGLFAKTHHGVNVLFEQHFIKTGEFPLKIGRWLARAQQAREEADYEPIREFTKAQVETAIKAAKEFVAEVEKLLHTANSQKTTK